MTHICDCGVGLVDLPSMNVRQCFSCGKTYEWKLKENQKSLLIKNLVGGIEKEIKHE